MLCVTAMKLSFLSLLFQLITLTRISSAARILVISPFPSISHQNVLTPYLNELARRGHQIVYYSTLPNKNIHPNVTFREIAEMKIFDFDDDDPLVKKTPPIIQAIYFYKYQVIFAQTFFQSKTIQNLIHTNEKFDIVIHEPFISSEFSAAFVHKFNALSVVYTAMADSSWLNENAGLPDNPSYMIDWRSWTTDRMSFYERAMNTLDLWAITGISYYYVNQMQDIVAEYMNYTGSESRPHLKELIVDNALILVNTHHSYSYNYPKAPHVKEIGGIHISSPKPLPENLAKFLDGATEGFIYFSLGSVINTKHKPIQNLKNHLLKAFATLKLKVLCKLHVDPSDVLPDNVMISQWVPQQDVLGHKNIKLFISHGGLQSTVEAVHHGVPILAIPVFCDQFKNAERVASAGFGKSIDLITVTSSSLLADINEIISNPKYKSQAVRRSNLLKDRPMTPLNEAAYWTEYVIKHGKTLQPASLRLSFIQLHQLDVLAFVSIVLVAAVLIVKQIALLLLSSLRPGAMKIVATRKTQ